MQIEIMMTEFYLIFIFLFFASLPKVSFRVLICFFFFLIRHVRKHFWTCYLRSICFSVIINTALLLFMISFDKLLDFLKFIETCFDSFFFFAR